MWNTENKQGSRTYSHSSSPGLEGLPLDELEKTKKSTGTRAQPGRVTQLTPSPVRVLTPSPTPVLMYSCRSPPAREENFVALSSDSSDNSEDDDSVASSVDCFFFESKGGLAQKKRESETAELRVLINDISKTGMVDSKNDFENQHQVQNTLLNKLSRILNPAHIEHNTDLLATLTLLSDEVHPSFPFPLRAPLFLVPLL